MTRRTYKEIWNDAYYASKDESDAAGVPEGVAAMRAADAAKRAVDEQYGSAADRADDLRNERRERL